MGLAGEEERMTADGELIGKYKKGDESAFNNIISLLIYSIRRKRRIARTQKNPFFTGIRTLYSFSTSVCGGNSRHYKKR